MAGGSAGFSRNASIDRPSCAGLDHAERRRLGARHRYGRHRHARSRRHVLVDHLPRVHPVDVIGAEDDHQVGLVVVDEVERLVDRVRGAGVPLRPEPLLGRDRRHEVAQQRAHPPGQADVPVQAVALVLGQHGDPQAARVGQVGQREVDQPVQAAEGDGGLGPVVGQRGQPLSRAARQHDAEDPLLRHLAPPPHGPGQALLSQCDLPAAGTATLNSRRGRGPGSRDPRVPSVGDDSTPRARRHVRRRRLGRGRRPGRRRGPPGDRRPPRAVREPAVLPDRRPRLLHAGRRPRRPPGRRRHRHPVLRLGHGRAVQPRTWCTTSSPSTRPGRTPNPCLRCNEKIKFTAVLDRAVALGFDAVCTGHHARLDGRRGRARLRRSVDPAKDQSYVLAVLTGDQLGRAMFPLGDYDQGRRCAGRPPRAAWPWPTSRTATTCASSPTATPGSSWQGRLGARPGPDRGRRRRACVGEPRRRLRLHRSASAGGCASAVPAPDGRPRYVLDIEPVPDGDRRPGRARSTCSRSRRSAPVWTGCAPPAGPDRLPGPAARARRAAPGHRRGRTATRCGSGCTSPPAAWPGARRRSSTTATPCSAPPPSPAPARRGTILAPRYGQGRGLQPAAVTTRPHRLA